MKTNILKTVLLFCTLLMPTLGFAQSDSHGGDVLFKDGKYFLLDFLEAGIEKTAECHTLEKRTELQKSFINGVFFTNLGFPTAVAECIAAQLSRYHDDFILAAFASVINNYDFRFVHETLEDVQDEFSTLKYNPKDILQAAVRRNQTIRINQDIYDALPLVEQAGLLIHEIVYAMITPIEVRPGMFHQDSDRAREVVGSIFDWKSDRQLQSFTFANKPILAFLNERHIYNLGNENEVNAIYLRYETHSGEFDSDLSLVLRNNLVPKPSKKKINSDSNQWMYILSRTPVTDLVEKNIRDYCLQVIQWGGGKNLLPKMTVSNAHWHYTAVFRDFLSTNGGYSKAVSLSSDFVTDTHSTIYNDKTFILAPRTYSLTSSATCNQVVERAKDQLSILHSSMVDWLGDFPER